MAKKAISWRHNDKIYTASLILTDSVEIESEGEMVQPSKGLGDTVKKAIDKVTGGKLKPCKGCKKRREALNKVMPYKGATDGR
tara:strand:- start:544 stop:792 length:249 start_codon:yes stop_codon:yes gene_type:complete